VASAAAVVVMLRKELPLERYRYDALDLEEL